MKYDERQLTLCNDKVPEFTNRVKIIQILKVYNAHKVSEFIGLLMKLIFND